MHQPWFRRALTLHRAMLLVLSMGYKADPLPLCLAYLASSGRLPHPAPAAQTWVLTVTMSLYLYFVLSQKCLSVSKLIRIKSSLRT
jgi:hypothetical protein